MLSQIPGDEPGPNDKVRKSLARIREATAQLDWHHAREINDAVEAAEHEHSQVAFERDVLIDLVRINPSQNDAHEERNLP